MINLIRHPIKYRASINKTMRDRQKQKKKDSFKNNSYIWPRKILIEVNHYEQQDKKIFPPGRGNTTLLVQYTGRYGEQTDASASSRYQTTTESRRFIPIFAQELCRQNLNQTDPWIEIPKKYAKCTNIS